MGFALTVNHRICVLPVTTNGDIRNFQSDKLLDVVIVSGKCIFKRHLKTTASASWIALSRKSSLDPHPHVVIATRGTNLHANTFGSPDVDQGFRNFQTKASPILNAPSPLVCSMVGSIVEELVNKVSIC